MGTRSEKKSREVMRRYKDMRFLILILVIVGCVAINVKDSTNVTIDVTDKPEVRNENKAPEITI